MGSVNIKSNKKAICMLFCVSFYITAGIRKRLNKFCIHMEYSYPKVVQKVPKSKYLNFCRSPAMEFSNRCGVAPKHG